MTRLGLELGDSIGANLSACLADEMPALLGAFAWYRSDYLALSGSKVTAWLDKSGNGHTLSQASAPNQPDYVASTAELSGKPAIRCNGTAYYLISGEATSTWNFLHNGTGCDVYMVGVQRSTSNGGHPWFSTGDGSPVATGLGVVKNTIHTPPLNLMLAGNGTGRIINDQTSVGPGDSVGTCLNYRYKEGNSPEWENLKSASGTSGNTGASAFAPSASDAAYPLNIGRNGGGATYGKIDFAEFVFFNRVLPAAERTLLRAYITNRYLGVTF